MLTQNQAALMIEEKDLNAKTLKEAIDEAFVDEGKDSSCMKNALKMGTPDAAYDLIQWADEIIDKGH